FSSRRRHTRSKRDWSSDVCSSDLADSAECAARPSSQSSVCRVKRVSETRLTISFTAWPTGGVTALLLSVITHPLSMFSQLGTNCHAVSARNCPGQDGVDRERSASKHEGGRRSRRPSDEFAWWEAGVRRAPPAGLEPATYRLEGGCSIRLSYGGSHIVTDGRGRTESGPGRAGPFESAPTGRG